MLTGLQTALNVVQACLIARVPILLWGPPGTGKSSAIRSVAKHLGMHVETIIAAVHDPTDFSGLPLIKGDRVTLVPPAWAVRSMESENSLIFFDEISTAPPSVQAALLRVVLERVVGELTLPETIRFVAAANPPGESGVGWELSAPLANRFCHVEWLPSALDISNGFRGRWLLPHVMQGNGDAAQMLEEFANFFEHRPDLCIVQPETLYEKGSGWPSPRSWEMAAKVLSATGPEIDSELETAILVGCVGPAGYEFLHWKYYRDLPRPQDLMNNLDLIDQVQDAASISAVLASVVRYALDDRSADTWYKAWDILGKVANTKPDLAVSSARLLSQHRPTDARKAPQAFELLRPLIPSVRLDERRS